MLRWRVLSLFVAVTAQTAAATTMNALAVRDLVAGNASVLPLAAWLLLVSVPALLLSPLIGSIVGTARPTLVMSIALAVGFVFILAAAYGDAPSLSSAAVMTLATIVACAAILRLAATDRPRLMTVCALLGIGVAFGALGAAWLVAESSQPERIAVLLGFVAWFAAVNSRFGKVDGLPIRDGIVRPFAAALRDATSHRLCRNALVGIAVWTFVAAMAVAAMPRLDLPIRLDQPHASLAAAALAGTLAAAWLRHPYRGGWPIPYAAALLLLCLLRLRFSEAGNLPWLGIGFALGWSLAPLLNYFLGWTTRPTATGPWVFAATLGATAAGLLLIGTGNQVEPRSFALNVMIGVTAVAALAAWIGFFRPALEVWVEAMLWPIYRIHGFGDAAKHLPIRGPAVVIANHSAWLDPLYLAKIVQGPIVPMMTSKFYDLPVIAFFMRRVIGTIRVPDSNFRHEAPELKDAVAALDRRDIIAMFPEGYLRRKEEVPLRRFGRGIVQILVDRPATPVFACWIEGGWGSFFSHRFGPPTKKKRFDFWRPIRIGVVGPIVVPSASMDDHLATRTFLSERVLEARSLLGLPPLAAPADEGDKE